MPKVNFSTENQRVFDLTLDLLRDDYSVHIDKEKLSKKDLENHLRNTINNDIYIRTARIVSYGLKYELSIGLCSSELIGWHPIVQPNEKVHL